MRHHQCEIINATNNARNRFAVVKFIQDSNNRQYIRYFFLKRNQNAPRPSEHPPVRGENVKTFRWDHKLRIQNLFMAFERVPLW